MEPRRTRQGTQFSPFEGLSAPSQFTVSEYKVVKTNLDLSTLLQTVQHDEVDDDDDLSEWEEVQSRPSTPPSRSPSPSSLHDSSINTCPPTSPSRSPSPSLPHNSSISNADSDDEHLSEPEAEAASPLSAAQRRTARHKEYQSAAARRNDRKMLCPPSPEARTLKASQITSTFKTADLRASGGGAWLGPKPPPPQSCPSGSKARSSKEKAKCQAERLKVLRLRTLHELLNEMGYLYIKWDGALV
ncbi:hypothetical protein FB451DRAFT_1375401 [Mycena latifolia]|nr:hypothetical protein FB451DRAFT_1375401 [Mycena latifolia]